MIISYKYISKLFTRAVSIEELLSAISSSGIEIESIDTKLSQMNNNIIFSTIEQIIDESELSTVRKCLVNIGQKETVSILCGANNIASGQMVIVALPGAILPGGMTIKEKNIAGHMSNGMICALDEIGLGGQDYDGIFIIDDKGKSHIKPGDRLCDLSYSDYALLPDNDVLIDISTPSNRIDLFSYMGIAHDIVKHIDNCDYSPIATTPMANINVTADSLIKFNTDLSDLTAMSLRLRLKGDINNYKLGGDELSLLEAAQINSHNIMVDISNVIMLLTGQPSHFFDADKIDGDYIIAEPIKDEVNDFIAINGSQYKLEPGSLVLRDNSKIVAVAGVSGALNTIVDDNTKEVIFEAVIWPMGNVRNTSRKMGLVTEAVKHYQRGLSGLVLKEQVLPLMLALLAEAKVDYEIINDDISLCGEDQMQAETVHVSRSWLKEFLAVDSIEDEDILKLVKSGFMITFSGEDMINITPPRYRNDIENRYDMAEEIIRIIGLDNIQEQYLEIENQADLLRTSFYFQSFLKKVLLTLGYSEIYNSSLSSSGHDGSVALLNPISSIKPYLRSSDNSMGSDMVEANLDIRDLYCFDLSKVFSYDQEGVAEAMQLTIIASSDRGMKEHLSATLSSLFKTLGMQGISFIQEAKIFQILNDDGSLLASISEHLYASNKGKRAYVQAILEYQALLQAYLKNLNDKPYNFAAPAVDNVIKRDITVRLPIDVVWASWKSELENSIQYMQCYYLDTFIKPSEKEYKFITFEANFDMNYINSSDIDAIITSIITK